MNLARLLSLFGLVALMGCDMGTVNPPPENVDEPTFELELMLKAPAEYGVLPEGFDASEYVDEIRSSDAAKGDEIEADLKALKALSNPEEIKVKAQEILSKL
jgi:hypothetical protein